MNEPEPWSELLDRAVPPMPDRLRAAPLAAIRRRAHRRGTVARVGGAALAVAALAAVGPVLTSAAVDQTPPSDRAASPDGRPVGWAMAKLHADGRTLSIGLTESSPPPPCRWLSLHTDSYRDRVVVGVYPKVGTGSCGTQTVVEMKLPVPLAGRRLVDLSDGRDRPVLPARLLPRPTYPTGLQQGADGAATASGGRVGWVTDYGGLGGPAVGMFATLGSSSGSPHRAERVGVNGFDAYLTQIPEDGRGHGYLITWSDSGWLIELRAVWAPADQAPRDVLQRILDGLRWA